MDLFDIFSDLLCCIPVRFCTFCCLRAVNEDESSEGPVDPESSGSIEPIASRETYETAQSGERGRVQDNGEGPST